MLRAARPGRLDERRLAAQEALLVGVEHGDERDLREVEALAQEVDAHEHVELAEPQLADDRDPVERVDLGVEVARPYAGLEQVVGQVLGHLLRQRRDEDALARLLAVADLVEEVVDLVPCRAQLHLGVDDAGRADQLLRDDLRARELERAGCRGDEHELVHLPQELVEPQRAVVERRRQAEAEVDERLLARAVAFVHPAELRHRLVRLVDEADEVVREVVDERERMRADRDGPRARASSSRCRCRSRAPSSSRGRTRCAGGSGAPRASGPRARTSRPAARARLAGRRSRARPSDFEVTYSVAGQMTRLSRCE